MNFLFDLPTWIGLLIVTGIVSLSGLFVVTQVKRIIQHKIKKQHEKIGRILFRVTAGLIALLISLSYANEQIGQSKIINSMESEAALLVNTGIKLRMLQSKEADLIKQQLINYINATIDDKWENIEANPFFSRTSQYLITADRMAYDLPTNNQNEFQIKKDLIIDINNIITMMQIRIYSQNALTPYLIYILGVGLVFLWIFFTVYELDIIALSFLSLYNILIGVLIYFIFMLSNPLIGPMKIDAHAFSIIKTKGFDKQNELK